MRPLRVQAEARSIAADLAIARSKLKALVLEIEEEAAGIDGRVVTRGKRKVEAAGQESQAELTRCANLRYCFFFIGALREDGARVQSVSELYIILKILFKCYKCFFTVILARYNTLQSTPMRHQGKTGLVIGTPTVGFPPPSDILS